MSSQLSPQDEPSTVEKVADLVRRMTHGRVRGLDVEEVQGRVIIRGRVPSHHTRQLALHAAMEILPGERFLTNITVG